MNLARIVLRPLLLIALCALPAQAQKGSSLIEVSLGGSTVVRVPSAGRVTLTDPSIADVSLAGGGLLVIGRKVGETNLILSGSGKAYTYLVKVTLPSRAIQSELAKMFPREDIEARAVGGALVLVGVVSSAPVVTQAEQVALGYLASPSIKALGVTPNVINLLRVKGRQQVQLEVTFAEVNRNSLREIGVNFIGANDKNELGAVFGSIENPGAGAQLFPGGLGSAVQGGTAPAGSVFFGKSGGSFPFSATLNILAENLLSKTLAQPTLVALSGQSAEFLAGGEIPIEVPSGPQQISIDFKKFGIQLTFTPTVLADKTIQLDTLTSVSAPDFSLGIISQNRRVPAFKTSASKTTVRLRDGQSFAVAGLLKEEVNNVIRKVPGLGDIPILGTLFSSKSFERNETELVVVITARLVDPMDADAVPPLPGEVRVSDPSDLEFFLLNIHEANGKRRPARMGGGDPMGAAPGVGEKSRRGPVGAIGFWR